MDKTNEEPAKLERVVGIGGVAFSSFNCIVGAGIFGLPGLVSGILGPAAIVAYVVCLVLIGLLGLCFAEAGSRVSRCGGLYAYANAAFGPVTGGVTGALLLFANSIAGAAALARFVLDTVASQFPLFTQPWAAIGLLAMIYLVLAVVNIVGTRGGARLTVAIGAIKYVPLVGLVVAGLFLIHPSNLAWPSVPKAPQVGEATLLLVFAFFGVESGLNVSGETRDPARTIPRAILLALVMVGALYIGLQVTAQGVLGAKLAHAPAPLVDLARVVFGPWGATLMVVTSVLSGAGYIIADMMVSPRIAFGLAEAGQMPRVLAYVHPRFRTPAIAIGLYAAAIVLLTASGTFQQLAVLATAGTLVIYLIVCLGVLRLRARKVAEAGTPFVAPGGVVVPLAATLIILWLLSTLSPPEWLATAAFVAVTALIYAAKAWRDRRTARLIPADRTASS